jgi:hypothetical protein
VKEHLAQGFVVELFHYDGGIVLRLPALDFEVRDELVLLALLARLVVVGEHVRQQLDGLLYVLVLADMRFEGGG